MILFKLFLAKGSGPSTIELKNSLLKITAFFSSSFRWKHQFHLSNLPLERGWKLAPVAGEVLQAKQEFQYINRTTIILYNQNLIARNSNTFLMIQKINSILILKK